MPPAPVPPGLVLTSTHPYPNIAEIHKSHQIAREAWWRAATAFDGVRLRNSPAAIRAAPAGPVVLSHVDAALIDADPRLRRQVVAAPADTVVLQSAAHAVVGHGAVLKADAAACAEALGKERAQRDGAAVGVVRAEGAAEVPIRREGDHAGCPNTLRRRAPLRSGQSGASVTRRNSAISGGTPSARK
jgi:hypothetical protein